MKLSEYIKSLQKLVDKHPEALNFDLIYSIDDEGNGYDRVYCEPCIGYYDGQDGFEDYQYMKDIENIEIIPNTVCIN